MTHERPVLKRSLANLARRLVRLLALPCLSCLGAPSPAMAETAFVATPVGPEIVVFDPARDACDGHDVPDVPLRAWRGADGTIHAFALHYENRRMSGKSLLSLKVECAIAFRSSGSGDPKKFDDRSWIAATWTNDGKIIHALAHHEFQANAHPGRCRFDEYMKCWWNSILTLKSTDGGGTFAKAARSVVLATPFPSEEEQGRHRGFFNPSNIIAKDGAYYMLAGTTGWRATQIRADQPGGACLFRTSDPASGEWLGFDGNGFSARFPDPYSGSIPPKQSCMLIAPFPAPVGGIVRHRSSGLFLAVYQAPKGASDGNGGNLLESGFYLSASRDLVKWSAPTLVLPAKGYGEESCQISYLKNYPVLIDEKADGRNFEDIGDEALLFYAETRAEGCKHTSDRKLIARKIRISTFMRD